MRKIPSAEDLLRDAYFAYVCTADEQNRPHITPVFFYFDESSGNIYFRTSRSSKKVNNLLKNNRVSLTIDVRDIEDPFNNTGIIVRGRADLSFDDAKTEAGSMPFRNSILIRLSEKYGPLVAQVASKDHDWTDVLVEVKPRRIVYWSGGPRFSVLKLDAVS
jgi:nitroimidazol reductase NimA-like FMN-containing flavoprotein (pyridoxamine 5'-phosphate oxidase superfamily)